jgi:hypothetical protein
MPRRRTSTALGDSRVRAVRAVTQCQRQADPRDDKTHGRLGPDRRVQNRPGRHGRDSGHYEQQRAGPQGSVPFQEYEHHQRRTRTGDNRDPRQSRQRRDRVRYPHRPRPGRQDPDDDRSGTDLNGGDGRAPGAESCASLEHGAADQAEETEHGPPQTKHVRWPTDPVRQCDRHPEDTDANPDPLARRETLPAEQYGQHRDQEGSRAHDQRRRRGRNALRDAVIQRSELHSEDQDSDAGGRPQCAPSRPPLPAHERDDSKKDRCRHEPPERDRQRGDASDRQTGSDVAAAPYEHERRRENG